MMGSREPGCRPPQAVLMPEYYIWPVEVPASWWEEYKGRKAERDVSSLPASSVTYDEAVMFCEWLSGRYGVKVRLPTVSEWEVAARSGVGGTTYPWGWSRPEGRAVYLAASAGSVNGFPPNAWGIFHMSGNVAEWCAADAESETAPALGGSWAERDPQYLRISHRLFLDKKYRDADVGFRFVIEAPPKETVALTSSLRE